MRERPILFSGAMVRAIHDGRKVQTRRTVKPQPNEDGLCNDSDPCPPFKREWKGTCGNIWNCPYGQPGDRLWVREEHHITLRDPRSVSVRYLADGHICPEVTIGEREHGLFCARKKPGAVTRARFMWRCLSRITLEVVSVRVERLQRISEVDAISEGVAHRWNGMSGVIADITTRGWSAGEAASSAIPIFRLLWQSINGPDSWAQNPWVWVVEFRRVEK